MSRALEEVYALSGKRTGRAAAKVSLTGAIWTHEFQAAFKLLKQAIHAVITLEHPDPNKLLCLFTGASDLHLSGVLTQIPKSDKDLPFENQRHDPLSFLSGSFIDSSSRWSTAEKEAFAIVESISRLDYMLLRPEVIYLFTDHKNLTYILNPASCNPQIMKHVTNKVEIWALRLSGLRYEVVHISGEENVWADLLSRWGSPNQPLPSQGSLQALFQAPHVPDFDTDFRWTTIIDLATAQQLSTEKGDEAIPLETNGSGLLESSQGCVWIPASSTDIQISLCIIGHTGRGGHRGSATTLANIKPHFAWKNMASDISSFVNSCLHCVATTGVYRVPSPMGHAIHADAPNEVIHFDFLYMGPSNDNFSYVFIIKYDASYFVWLEPCTAADSTNTVEVLLRWFESFGVAQTWVSDRGSHSKNDVITALNKALHSNHHLTTPASPKSNGTVETVCKEVILASRELLSEFCLKPSEWTSVIRIVQSIISHSVRPTLNNRAPITVFTGLPADNPLRTLLPSGIPETRSLDFIKAKKISKTDILSKYLDNMHCDVKETRTLRREEAIKRHNDKTHVHESQLDTGDFVLVAKKSTMDGHKLHLKWLGPRRVTRALSDHSYEVQNILTKKLSLVHANRLKFYADSRLYFTEELRDTIDHNNPVLNTVSRLLDLRYNATYEQFEVQTKWRGFPYEDPTWEPYDHLRDDIPDMLATFLESFPNQDVVAEVTAT